MIWKCIQYRKLVKYLIFTLTEIGVHIDIL